MEVDPSRGARRCDPDRPTTFESFAASSAALASLFPPLISKTLLPFADGRILRESILVSLKRRDLIVPSFFFFFTQGKCGYALAPPFYGGIVGLGMDLKKA